MSKHGPPRRPVHRSVTMSVVTSVPPALWSLWNHMRAFPFATNLSLISVPIGLLALCIGPEISASFTNVYDTPAIVYIWGVVLLFGGGYVLYGIGWHVPSLERAGLLVLAATWAFYGASVIAALGWGGLVAGPITLTLAACAVLRAQLILTAARTIAHVVEDADDVGIISDVHTGLIAPVPPTPPED